MWHVGCFLIAWQDDVLSTRIDQINRDTEREMRADERKKNSTTCKRAFVMDIIAQIAMKAEVVLVRLSILLLLLFINTFARVHAAKLNGVIDTEQHP